MSAAALTYECLLRQVHGLLLRGLGNTPLAGDLAARLDAPWSAMSKTEQAGMRNLDAELYVIRKEMRR